jgi:hypothetical protein
MTRCSKMSGFPLVISSAAQHTALPPCRQCYGCVKGLGFRCEKGLRRAERSGRVNGLGRVKGLSCEKGLRHEKESICAKGPTRVKELSRKKESNVPSSFLSSFFVAFQITTPVSPPQSQPSPSYTCLLPATSETDNVVTRKHSECIQAYSLQKDVCIQTSL